MVENDESALITKLEAALNKGWQKFTYAERFQAMEEAIAAARGDIRRALATPIMQQFYAETGGGSQWYPVAEMLKMDFSSHPEFPNSCDLHDEIILSRLSAAQLDYLLEAVGEPVKIAISNVNGEGKGSHDTYLKLSPDGPTLATRKQVRLGLTNVDTFIDLAKTLAPENLRRNGKVALMCHIDIDYLALFEGKREADALPKMMRIALALSNTDHIYRDEVLPWDWGCADAIIQVTFCDKESKLKSKAKSLYEEMAELLKVKVDPRLSERGRENTRESFIDRGNRVKRSSWLAQHVFYTEANTPPPEPSFDDDFE